MRIHTKVVIDLNSMEVVEEEGYEYSGAVAEAKGGGGSTGAVEFPAYIEEMHHYWLDRNGLDGLDTSMTQAMNNAMQGNSPFNVEVYDITPHATAIGTASAALKASVDLMSQNTQLDETMQNILADSKIAAMTAAHSDRLQDELESTAIPLFEAGMRDVNAVQSSAFVIGKAILQESKDKRVAEFDAAATFKVHGEDSIKVAQLKLDYQKQATHYAIEAERITSIMHNEKQALDVEYEFKDKTFDITMYEYGGNLMAAPTGGVVNTVKGPSKLSSAIGGALSGAAAGAMAGAAMGAGGGPIGMGVGAVLGLAAGLA